MDNLKIDKLISLLNRALNQSGKMSTPEEYTCICPFHQAIHSITKKKFGINLEDGNYNCFACGVKGRTFKSLFRKLKVGKKLFDELHSIIGEEKRIYRKASLKDNINNTILELPHNFHPMYIPSKIPQYKHAFLYLIKRGITRDDMLRYNIGYCPDGEYANMVIIPSYDADGNLNFYQGRSYLKDTNYKHKSPSWSKDIIGFESFINWDLPVTLVEGAFDAISVRRNAIPLFGKFLSNTLKNELYECDEVNILLDNDALSDAEKLFKELKKEMIIDRVKLIKLESGKDPSEVGFNETNKKIKITIDSTDVDVFEINLKNTDIDSKQSKF
jgi:DNA primase